MFMRVLLALAGVGLSSVALAQATMAPPAGAPGAQWEAGKHYFVIDPPQPTATPGKVEVLEVFSYGCPHCNEFQPIAENIKKALPAGAQMRYLPAEFGRASWTIFARAYYAAEALGTLDKTHAAVIKAVYVDKSIDSMNPP